MVYTYNIEYNIHLYIYICFYMNYIYTITIPVYYIQNFKILKLLFKTVCLLNCFRKIFFSITRIYYLYFYIYFLVFTLI